MIEGSRWSERGAETTGNKPFKILCIPGTCLAVGARRMPQQGPSSQAGPNSRADSEPAESSDVCRCASYCRSADQGRSAALRAAATSGLAGGFKTSCGFTEPAASCDVWRLHVPLSVCERPRGSAGSPYARRIRTRLPIRTLLRLVEPRSGLGLFTLSCGNDRRLNRYHPGGMPERLAHRHACDLQEA
jgi:hypothetical protein